MSPEPSAFAVFADPAFASSAGIERYTQELIRGIAASPLAGGCVLVTTAPERARELAPALEVREVGVPGRALRYLWAAGGPTLEAVCGRPLAFAHSPTHQRLPSRSCPSVVTIHDVAFSRFPELMTSRQRLVGARRLERRAVRSASRLIADSLSTRRDLIEVLGVDPGRITVVALGVDHEVFRPVADAERGRQVRAAHGIGPRYVLYVGSLYARKLGNLLEAFARVAAGDPEVELVVVGGRENSGPGRRLAERIAQLGLGDRVVRPGVVAQEDLPVLMSGAAVFAYVSFYEGFGLSPLEAMACGAPVVVSDASSLPEVVGDAGTLVDPGDVEAIAAALLHVLGLGDAERAQAATASLAQAAQFSWDRTIAETLGVYEDVAGAR